jgi:hypothetical protein
MNETPLSRHEVLEKDREKGERTRRWRDEQEKARGKTRAKATAPGPKPMTQDDVDAYERRREEHNREVRANNEARRIAFEAKRVAEERDPTLWQGGPRAGGEPAPGTTRR